MEISRALGSVVFGPFNRKKHGAFTARQQGGGAMPRPGEGGVEFHRIEHAQAIGALAIAMACVPASQAPMPCEIDIRLLSGPELLTGSTRLKAGTATKMALNILSTGVMVRLGKVHGNRMVDVAVTNSKLEDRALRILRDLAGVPRERGRGLLEASGGSVKLALLMAVSGLEAAAAREQLQRHGPGLRPVLAALGLEASLDQMASPQ